jgi:hypothetical protein
MSLKTTIFPSCLNECLSSMLFLPNSSLVNEFILLDRCSYGKKGYTVKPRYDL